MKSQKNELREMEIDELIQDLTIGETREMLLDYIIAIEDSFGLSAETQIKKFKNSIIT